MLQTGRRSRTPRMEILWRPNSVGHPRLGLVVPRHGQSAVSRNRLRRRLRELARRRVLPDLEAIDLIIRSRRRAYVARLEELAADLDRWVRSLSA
ncbi:MAG: ribonuclease P protein component [Gemmatimonadales bacterium]